MPQIFGFLNEIWWELGHCSFISSVVTPNQDMMPISWKCCDPYFRYNIFNVLVFLLLKLDTQFQVNQAHFGGSVFKACFKSPGSCGLIVSRSETVCDRPITEESLFWPVHHLLLVQLFEQRFRGYKRSAGRRISTTCFPIFSFGVLLVNSSLQLPSIPDFSQQQITLDKSVAHIHLLASPQKASESNICELNFRQHEVFFRDYKLALCRCVRSGFSWINLWLHPSSILKKMRKISLF